MHRLLKVIDLVDVHFVDKRDLKFRLLLMSEMKSKKTSIKCSNNKDKFIRHNDKVCNRILKIQDTN
jgi:hypothetical protein